MLTVRLSLKYYRTLINKSFDDYSMLILLPLKYSILVNLRFKQKMIKFGSSAHFINFNELET